MSRLKQLGKDSIVYGIGGIFAKAISFFTLPIYTRIFNPADYGSIEMLIILSSFLGSIMTMGMDSAQSMFFFKYRDDGKAAQVRLVSSILQWRILWGICLIFLATLLSPLLNSAFFSGNLGWQYFAVAFTTSLFVQVTGQCAQIMRLLYRPWKFIGITTAQSSLAILFILYFAGYRNDGINGYILGSFTSSVSVAFLGWYVARNYIKFSSLHHDLWPMLLRFGAPLLPAGLANYLMDTSDRWFVQYFHGPSSLGLFAIGAKFGMIMFLFVNTFRSAWWPIAMDSMQSSDGPSTFRMISRLYIGVCAVGVVLLTFASRWLVQFFTAPSFHDAWPIVGILSWQALFYGFFLIASAGIWKSEKTYLNLYITSISALVGLFLNWLIVPFYGFVGASVATVFTYFIWVLATMIASEKYWRVGFPWLILAIQLIVAASFTTLYLIYWPYLPFALVICVCSCVIVIELLLAFERNKILNFLRFLSRS